MFQGNNCIMVVMYQFIKYVHLCYCYHYFKASTIIVTLLEKFQKLHEILNIVVSDKAPILISNFWNKIFSCLGTQLAHISSFHHQYYVKIGHVNKCQ